MQEVLFDMKETHLTCTDRDSRVVSRCTWRPSNVIASEWFCLLDICLVSSGAVWASLSRDLMRGEIRSTRLHDICFLCGVSVKFAYRPCGFRFCFRWLGNNQFHHPSTTSYLWLLQLQTPPETFCDAIPQLCCHWLDLTVTDWLCSQRLPRNPSVTGLLLCGTPSQHHQAVWGDRLSCW